MASESLSGEKGDIPVIILCGGKGLRLRPMTQETPKPLLQIGQRTIVEHVMANFRSGGFSNFNLCVGYLSEKFEDHFSTSDLPSAGGSTGSLYSEQTQSVELIDSGVGTGLADRISVTLDQTNHSRAIVTYGDTLADVDVDALFEFHKSHDSNVTITGVNARCRYGVLRRDGESVTQFDEKPMLSERINGGFFVLDKAAFSHFDSDDGLVETINRISDQGELQMFEHDGYFDSVDTHKDLQRVREITEGRTSLPWMHD